MPAQTSASFSTGRKQLRKVRSTPWRISGRPECRTPIRYLKMDATPLVIQQAEF